MTVLMIAPQNDDNEIVHQSGQVTKNPSQNVLRILSQQPVYYEQQHSLPMYYTATQDPSVVTVMYPQPKTIYMHPQPQFYYLPTAPPQTQILMPEMAPSQIPIVTAAAAVVEQAPAYVNIPSIASASSSSGSPTPRPLRPADTHDHIPLKSSNKSKKLLTVMIKKQTGACTECHRNKTRCDFQRPCQRCAKKGVAHLCCDRAPEQKKPHRKLVSRACLCCIKAKTACDRQKPCRRCTKMGVECIERPPTSVLSGIPKASFS